MLLCLPRPGNAQSIEFQPREHPQQEWSWLSTESWSIKGHRIVKLGPLKLRDRSFDDRSSHSCAARIAALKGTAVADLRIQCERAESTEGNKTRQLPVTGFEVRGLGVGAEREFKTAQGRRLKKAQRAFFARHFRDRDPQEQDPMEFLLPEGAVSPGDSWSMDLVEIQDWFGPDRFTINLDLSHARVSLDEVLIRHDEPFARLVFSVLIVPATIRDGEFKEARMALEGTVLLPLRGDLPYMELELATTMRFVGKVRAKGLRVSLDIDTQSEGSSSRLPVP
ncbi:MAG: hypothetical protein CMP23_08925 [Rickettsiales bacterium]|nr:hypothetical protein [Rickettsiales bacterium]|tara:strand:- start:154 stop:993 length:840 start_codon:yes stop_codon:yes gene_type:complete